VEGVGHVDSELNNVNNEPAQGTPEPDVAVNEINETAEPSTNPTKKRKRKEREEESKVDEIESRYMNKVYSKIAKEQDLGASGIPSETPLILHETHEGEDIDPGLLQHETLTSSSDNAEKTLFLSNVPVKVLTSKPLLKQLKQLFSTHGQISSIRFRSIAFSEGGPRKLAFVTKKLHSERDSLNAYIVYQRTESVDSAVRELNGHFWEGKHFRVDSVAHPTVLSYSRYMLKTAT
jgi:nucleolar protein 12